MTPKNTAQKLARIKARTAKLRKQNQILARRIHAEREVNAGSFDIRRAIGITPDMSQPPTVTRIAEAYGVSRQRVYQMQRRHRLSRAEMLDGDVVFRALLKNAKSSPMRRRLIDPLERERITQLLNP